MELKSESAQLPVGGWGHNKKQIPMNQNVIAIAALVLLGGGIVLSQENNNTASSGEPPMFKAVVHINFSDSERQKHGLKNVANMLKEVEKFEIEVVCHGSGIGLLVMNQSDHAEEIERLSEQGIRFAACENTMRDKAIPEESLLPGVETIPSGAVEVIRKQQDGYAYFRP